MSLAMKTQAATRPSSGDRSGQVLGGLLGGLALLAAAAPAQAALVLPPPDLKTIVNAGFNPQTIMTSSGPATLAASDTSNGATATASVQVNPGVLVQATLSSTNQVFASGGSGQGLLTYRFGVTGPAGLIIPIHMLAKLDVQTFVGADAAFGKAKAFGDSTLEVFGSGVNRTWFITAASGDGAGSNPGAQTLLLDELFQITPNTGYSVKESAYSSGSYSGMVAASADPYFFIDPAFLLAHPGYDLIFSPGVGDLQPGGAVPEPAAWAMMLLGFAALGSVLRARRTRRDLLAAI